MTFEEYLGTKYSRSVIDERLRFHNKNIEILENSRVDVDHLSLDPVSIQKASNTLRNGLSIRPYSHIDTRLRTFEQYCEYLQYLSSIRRPRFIIHGQAQPIDPPSYGSDRNSNFIFYSREIPEDRRVPGLVEFLLCEYDSIISSAYMLIESQGSRRMPEFSSIPVILSDETPVESEPYDNEYYADLIIDLNKKTNGGFNKKDILDILEKFFKHRLMGRYFTNYYEKGPCIKLYYRNIKYNTEKEYFLLLAMTLAHEFLHHLHHLVVGTDEFSRQDKYARRVQESLADFFGVFYMLRTADRYNDANRRNVAYQRYIAWQNGSSCYWPYSYALHYFDQICGLYDIPAQYPNQIADKYLRVFNDRSFDVAYSLLVHRP